MTWVGWRQQRLEAVVVAVMLAAVAALLVPTGLTMLSAYHHDGLASCVTGPPGGACDDVVHAFQQRFDRLGNLIAWFTLIPGLFGVLLAAPLINQLEQGTYRLDWTQGITRRRWVTVKLGLAVLSAVVAAGVFIALVTWWRTPLVRIEGRMENSVYDSEGVVAVGYTLFALGLAVAIGVVWRRAVPALVTAFGLYFAARLVVDTWLRQHLVAPLHVTFPARGNGPDLNHAWVLSQYPSDAHGHALATEISCPHGAGGACAVPKELLNDVQYFHAVYHAASHFWPLQAIECSLFAGAAAALLAFAAWWTIRKVA
jgi:hypothetical protein